jgi:hypothetical protein
MSLYWRPPRISTGVQTVGWDNWFGMDLARCNLKIPNTHLVFFMRLVSACRFHLASSKASADLTFAASRAPFAFQFSRHRIVGG